MFVGAKAPYFFRELARKGAGKAACSFPAWSSQLYICSLYAHLIGV